MSDRILSKFVSRNGSEAVADALAGDDEQTEDFGCFGWLRGAHERAVAVELRKKNGHAVAINYAYINRFEFVPDTGILLHCTDGGVVKIKGRNLNTASRPRITLFCGLTRFAVPWVAELDRAQCLSAKQESAVVEGIEW